MYRTKDAMKMREALTVAIRAAIEDVLGHPTHFKVNSSNIMHTDLQPEGDVFTITFQVATHKKEKKDDPPRSEP
jgi:hypothetical protein